MSFNDKAIQAFGLENRDMSLDSSWHGLDEHQGRLQTYLDARWVRRWYLRSRAPAGGGVVLDVGSGKGRMARFLAEHCRQVVAIEPFGVFFEDLARLAASRPNLQVRQSTFAEYVAARNAEQVFDMIYVSGVTPYFDDRELEGFFRAAKTLLSPTGVLMVRELGAVRRTQYASGQVNRTPRRVTELALKCGLFCERRARAYPFYIFEWLFQRHPNVLTRLLRELALKPGFYPLWNFLARLNLPSVCKLPRGRELDYHLYLLRRC